MSRSRRDKTPWLVWRGGLAFACKRCGWEGMFPGNISVRMFTGMLKLLQQEHADCQEPAPAEEQEEQP